MILLSVDQTNVYDWLKDKGKDQSPIETIAKLDTLNTLGALPIVVERSLRSLANKEQYNVLQAYISWYNY